MTTPSSPSRTKAPRYILTEEIERELAEIKRVSTELEVLSRSITAHLEEVRASISSLSNRLIESGNSEHLRRVEAKKILEGE